MGFSRMPHSIADHEVSQSREPAQPQHVEPIISQGSIGTANLLYGGCEHKSQTQKVNLLTAPKGKLLWIDSITNNASFGDIDTLVSRRLKDFGMLPNTAIRVVSKSLFGRPPIVVQIADGSQFILRKEEAQKIQCRFI